MSKNRRKRQIRNRIIAFIMAVAMVFTVVKVNDSKKEVKAGEAAGYVKEWNINGETVTLGVEKL